jgi:hypothetical protein
MLKTLHIAFLGHPPAGSSIIALLLRPRAPPRSGRRAAAGRSQRPHQAMGECRQGASAIAADRAQRLDAVTASAKSMDLTKHLDICRSS